jgi:uncharacterized protein YijF (DUF1287 family)
MPSGLPARARRLVLATVAASAALLAWGGAASADDADFTAKVIARAREEVAHQVSYDSSYVSLAYPNGDVDPARGVCTDVVVRALRAGGLDLQSRLHEDELAHRDAYPLGQGRVPDANIDHRRVGPLLTWFRRHAEEATTTVAPETWSEFHPGDVVVFTFTPCPACRSKRAAASHIGIVSDRKTAEGRPMVLHNFGPSATEDDGLTFWPLLAHFHLSERLLESRAPVARQ